MARVYFELVIAFMIGGIVSFSPALAASHTEANQSVYEVQVGDTLSEICQKWYSGAKVYGKGGALQKIIALNPIIKNPNRIKVGQKIALRKGVLESNLSNARSIASEMPTQLDLVKKEKKTKSSQRCRLKVEYLSPALMQQTLQQTRKVHWALILILHSVFDGSRTGMMD